MPKVDLEPPLFSSQVREARRFFLGPGESGEMPIVVGGGLEHVSPNYLVSRSQVPFIAVELVVAGRGTATVDGKTFDLTPGTLFLYGERVAHKLTTSRDHLLTKYFLDLDGKRSRSLLRSLAFRNGEVWRLSQWLDLARLFDEIIHHGSGHGPGRQAICDALMRACLLTAKQSVRSDAQAGESFTSYQKCCTLIDTAHHRLRSLEDLAGEVNLDVAYVCRLFKRYDKQSPYQRLLRHRMTSAAARLYEGHQTISEVAYALGYADPFHFSRAFKRIIGLPPSKFRPRLADNVKSTK